MGIYKRSNVLCRMIRREGEGAIIVLGVAEGDILLFEEQETVIFYY